MAGKVFLETMLFEQYLEIGRDLCQADKTNKGFRAEGTVGARAPRQKPKNVGYLVNGSSFWNCRVHGGQPQADNAAEEGAWGWWKRVSEALLKGCILEITVNLGM